MQVPANLRPGAFAGTAEDYATFRPPYPPAFLALLLARAGIERGCALLDIATGPGRIALDLAPRFERVVAIDLEPEMIDVAKRRAAGRGTDNVQWLVGRAEELELADGSFDLITIGEAFHRVEQAVVVANAFRWLRHGGGFASMTMGGRFLEDEPWQLVVREVRHRWMTRAFPEGVGTVLPGGVEDQAGREAVLLAAGFVDLEVHQLEERRSATADEIIGYLASSSTCSRHVLGADFPGWESDIRTALAEFATLPETFRWAWTLARKPRS